MRVGVLLMVFSALSNVGGICKRRYTKRTFCTFVYIVCVLDRQCGSVYCIVSSVYSRVRFGDNLRIRKNLAVKGWRVPHARTPVS